MGSYLTAYNKHRATEPEQTIQEKDPSDSELNRALMEILKVLYGDTIQAGAQLGSYRFIASNQKMLFDTALSPDRLDVQKMTLALTNQFNIEIVYFIESSITIKHPQISYRNISDYVKVLKSKNRTDLIRWINQFRNKFEASNALTRQRI